MLGLIEHLLSSIILKVGYETLLHPLKTLMHDIMRDVMHV